MTTYPNPGERSEGIGGPAEDAGSFTSTEALAPADRVPPPSPSEDPGGYDGGNESTTGGSVASGGLSGVTGSPTYVPSSTTTPSVSGSGVGSKSDVAKSEASDVKDAALSAGSNVAGAAKDEAGNVVQEVGAQARGLLDQLRSDLREQGSGQKDRIASTVHSLSRELGAMASRSEENGPVTDLAHQASRKGGEVAHWLESHEPADVLAEVKRYARRRPFAFLAMCAAAGVVAGRLTRGAVAANTSLDSPDSGSSGRALTSGDVSRTQTYAPAPGPYAASVGADVTSSDPYAASPGPYAAGAATPVQSWPPEQDYGQAPAGYVSPQTDPGGPLAGETGTLNGPPLSPAGGSYGAGESLPVSDESGRGPGEFRR